MQHIVYLYCSKTDDRASNVDIKFHIKNAMLYVHQLFNIQSLVRHTSSIQPNASFAKRLGLIRSNWVPFDYTKYGI